MSSDRILTTHVGSLPRPHHLLDMMKARLAGEGIDEAQYEAAVQDAVDDCVARQVASGIDIVGDGEMSKPGFYTYVAERLAGFVPDPGRTMHAFEGEVAAFPEYYEQYFAQFMVGGAVAPVVPLVCTGPVTYCGHDALANDIAHLRSAVAKAGANAAFIPAVAPSGAGFNGFYASDDEYLAAVAGALSHEYRAIVDAGFSLQIDDPFLSDIFGDPNLDDAERARRAGVYVEVVNAAIAGLPTERIRYHTCYGINEGPRIHEADFADVAPFMLQVNAGAYSFEAANARHEHEYHLWETLHLPDDKQVIPGVITHASNIVEHPELIAERLLRFTKLVGRDRVIAGVDCGFSSQAMYTTEIHPTVIWAKFQALARGAELATQRA